MEYLNVILKYCPYDTHIILHAFQQVSRVMDFGSRFNNATIFNADISGWE